MPPQKNKLSFPKDGNTPNQSTLSKPRTIAKPTFAVPMPPPPLLLPKIYAKGKGRATESRGIQRNGKSHSPHVQARYYASFFNKAILSIYFSHNIDGIWADMYPPTTEQELAVHKKKVEVVRRWLTDAFEGANLRKYRKLLILSGPAGAGKTATLRVLSTELQFDVIEWKNATDDVFTDAEYDSLSQKFQAFMHRASGMASLATSSGEVFGRQVILLEDLPNLLHGPTLQIFQSALAEHIENSNCPVILIISDAGSRGEHRDEEGWMGRQVSIVDVRTIIPPRMLQSPYVTRVDFNPIAKTLMKKGLQYAVDRHFGATSKAKPSRETLELVAESSEGDVRGALMALQFACSVPPGVLPGKKSKKAATTALLLITKREHSLALFHMLGKVLYNKRVGDPFSESLNKKDQEHERELDRLVPPPALLPSHLSQFSRRSSRVDPNVLYADSPIDTSLYSLYLHQNYYQFCSDTEQCDGVIESLSLIDSMGDAWDSRGQVAAAKFYALTLGTLISLPSPVPRLNQKMFKPEYFEHLKRTEQASDAVSDVKDWIAVNDGSDWSSENTRMWLPSVLKQPNVAEYIPGLPPHHKFSSIPWVRAVESTATALEEENEYDALEPTQETPRLDSSQSGSQRLDATVKADQKAKFWLEEDDIGEF